MESSAIEQLEPGKAYLVSHRESPDIGRTQVTRKVRRIFKGLEKRFGAIPCAIFTAKVDKATSASYNKETCTLTISGKRLPISEVSIPHYDIVVAEPA
jgi:hypothetical protein